MNTPQKQGKSIIGWREWVSLPELGILRMKAKIDTGARTSALHTFWLETYQEQGKNKVRFAIHPRQRSRRKAIICTADLIDVRAVMDSGGHQEQRCVIKTLMVMKHVQRTIEITLTNRDDMRFRMLLGRTALRNVFQVDPAASYLLTSIKS